MSAVMRQCPPASTLVDETGELANFLDHFVVVVLGRYELRAIEDGEQLWLINAKDRRLQPLGEPIAKRLVQVAARNPMVIGIGRRLPDHRYRLGVDLTALELL